MLLCMRRGIAINGQDLYCVERHSVNPVLLVGSTQHIVWGIYGVDGADDSANGRRRT